MNEKEDTTQTPKQKIPISGIISLLLGILGISAIVFRIAFYRPWWSEYVARNVIGLSGIFGLIIGLIAIRKISKSITTITFLLIILFIFLFQPFPFLLFIITRNSAVYRFLLPLSNLLSIVILLVLAVMPAISKWRSYLNEKLIGGILANSGIVLGLFLFACWWMETCMPAATAVRMVCGSNMARLGRTIMMYSKDHQGRYPDPDQWCNLLLEYDQVEKSHFLCSEVKYRWKRQIFTWPVPRNKECYYAINPNCEPNSPPDTVLLFETEGGWNKSGGPELLTTKNHGGDGCNILFNGNYADFISTRKIGDLKWSDEENNE